MKIKFFKKLKSNKPLRGIANIALGVLNGLPVVSNYAPSVQDFNEEIEQADLNLDGKVGNVGKKELIVYYVLNHLGLIGTILLIIFGLIKGIDKDTIEWAIDLLNKYI